MGELVSIGKRRFDQEVGELLRERQGKGLGRVSLREFVGEDLHELNYETVRKQVKGDLTLQPETIEAIAKALGVPPSYFREYRRFQIVNHLYEDEASIDVVYAVLGLIEHENRRMQEAWNSDKALIRTTGGLDREADPILSA